MNELKKYIIKIELIFYKLMKIKNFLIYINQINYFFKKYVFLFFKLNMKFFYFYFILIIKNHIQKKIHFVIITNLIILLFK